MAKSLYTIRPDDVTRDGCQWRVFYKDKEIAFVCRYKKNDWCVEFHFGETGGYDGLDSKKQALICIMGNHEEWMQNTKDKIANLKADLEDYG